MRSDAAAMKALLDEPALQVMPGCGDDLRATLEARGYRIVVVPLPEFLRSGGAAFCLTLRLDRRAADARATAVA